MRLGVELGELVDVAPVGGAAPAVEQPGLAEHERGRAVGEDVGARGRGRARTTSTTSGRGLEEVALGRDADQVGVGGGLEAVVDVEVEAGRRPSTRPGRGVPTGKSKTGLSSSGW